MPEAKSGEPVFYVSCKIGSEQIKLEAGNLGYNMEPGFKYDSTKFVLTSRLFNPACADCYSLSVQLNDFRHSSSSSSIIIDSALHLGTYSFSDKKLAPLEYVTTVSPQLPKDPTGTYNWTVTSDAGKQEFTGYQFNYTFSAGKKYTLALRYEDATGCAATHKNSFLFGTGPMPQVLVRSQYHNGLEYKFEPLLQTEEGMSYYWDFGDGQHSYEKSPTHAYEFIGSNYYTAKLTVTDPQNQKHSSSFQVPGTTSPLCSSNFSMAITPVTRMTDLSKVIIELGTPDGKVYSTAGVNQPESAVFEVIEVENYTATPEGPTRKYKARFNCLLKAGAEELQVNEAEVVLAVSYR